MIINIILFIASATTIAGFFGMNLIHGFEESPTAFMAVCSLSTLLGVGVTSASSWYSSEGRLRKLTASRYREIELIKSSLNHDNSVSASNHNL